MPLTRRLFLTSCAAAGFLGASGQIPVAASGFASELRGSLDATRLGVRPSASDDQSRKLQKAIDAAAGDGRPLRLPPGRYTVSNINLPAGVRLLGIPGKSVLVYGGGGHLIFAEDADDIALTGIVFDGGNRALGDYTPALVHIATSKRVAIEECEIIGSRKSALVLDRVGGRVERCSFIGAAETGLQSNEGAGLTIADNGFSDIAGNAIRVWRWQSGEDGTVVSGNRIDRIATGQGGGDDGNGIDIFRARSVFVANNRISDCSGSAVRVRYGGNVQITGNGCSQTGTPAIAIGHDTDGAMIVNNLIDEAAAGITVGFAEQGSKLAVCSGNILRNIHDRGEGRDVGIGISVAADAAVSGNVIENAARIGIRIGFGSNLRDVAASGNVIRKAAIGIAVSVSTGSGQATISDNIISEARDGAIVGMDHLEISTEDLAVNSRRVPPHLQISGNKIG